MNAICTQNDRTVCKTSLISTWSVIIFILQRPIGVTKVIWVYTKSVSNMLSSHVYSPRIPLDRIHGAFAQFKKKLHVSDVAQLDNLVGYINHLRGITYNSSYLVKTIINSKKVTILITFVI